MAAGFCHFNDNDERIVFEINLFGINFQLKQAPGSTTMGHGAVVWDSSIVFAKYMEHNPQLFCSSDISGKTLLELGSGCGLAGLSFMVKGAEVTLTDLPHIVEELTVPNAETMFSRVRSVGSPTIQLITPRVLPLDWTDRAASISLSSSSDSPYFDFILMTDCVFNGSLTSSIIETLREHSNSKTEVYCCYEIRDEEINADFLQQLGQFYHVKRIKISALHPSYSNDLIQLVRAKIKRKNAIKS